MPELSVNPQRLWSDHMRMAEIGPSPEGGSNRPALSALDAEARAMLAAWCEPLALAEERDALGNTFYRRAGRDARPAIAFGSHLDTVPTGGRFDGVSGVLAGLEVMRVLHQARITTSAPLELVNWTNEEGTRFRPAMMGSRVHAGDMTLQQALAVRDDAGTSVAEALAEHRLAGPNPPGPRDWAAFLELHIEQGPVLETTGRDIGIVTGTVQARYFQIVVTGAPSHAGPMTMERRRDSLAAAAELVLAVERIGIAGEPGGRSSTTWITNSPNARGAVANITRLHSDVRHEDPARAAAMQAELIAAAAEIATRRQLAIDIDPYTTFGPVRFDTAAAAALRDAAAARQMTTRDMLAVAGHDAVMAALVCPAAMLFIPSVGGISHNPGEYSTPQHVANGAQVLLDAVLRLAA
ncbi:MAG: hydantoinase/carbamoylase family amidase [Acetobacteraceae bacterium]|nr:hydantoinase/carbamoylase family amidase [Acetobacteraceae bacterium]